MAKNSKSFDEAVSNAVDDLLKDYKSAMKIAVKFAAQKAEEDLMAKAKSCLEEYYDSYEPNRYDRTETLQYAFLPYSNIKYGSDKIIGKVGVEYSAEMLAQFIGDPIYYIGRDGTPKVKHSGYYGSSNYQPVDTWWVIDNYLRGVHPVTNGGKTSEDAIYYEIYDDVSPNQKMETFIKNYEKTFDENVLLGLLGQIAKKIK